MSYPPLDQRPMANTICLFDVDNTLTVPRRVGSPLLLYLLPQLLAFPPKRQVLALAIGVVTPEMLALLHKLRQSVAIGFVGGSDLAKQQEQLGTAEISVTSLFDFCFSENGLIAFKQGRPLSSHSFIKWIGEEKYKQLVRFILHYVADLDIPIKRGTFVEFRNGMMNVSPIGRNASVEERDEFQRYDDEHKVRETFIAALKEAFPDLGLVYSIGGQISFDVFPKGWDKTYCLQHLENEAKLPGGISYTTIHFFGDKTYKGGNDYEIYEDPRTIGHSVLDPDDTARQLKELFKL